MLKKSYGTSIRTSKPSVEGLNLIKQSQLLIKTSAASVAVTGFQLSAISYQQEPE
jgi:hypothetical protein